MSNETLTLRQTDNVVPAQAAHWQSLWLGIGVVGVVVQLAFFGNKKK